MEGVWRIVVSFNLICLLVLGGWCIASSLPRLYSRFRSDWGTSNRTAWLVLVAAVLGGAILRLVFARMNILLLGGVSYSRMLDGYPGFWAVASAYEPFYLLFGRSMEVAVFINRLMGSFTIVAVGHILFQVSGSIPCAALGALATALFPLHIVFSASSSLAVPFVLATALLAGSTIRLVRETDILSLAMSSLFALLLTQVRPEGLFVLFLWLPVMAWAWYRKRRNPWFSLISLGTLGGTGFYAACAVSSQGSTIQWLLNGIEQFPEALSSMAAINLLNPTVIPPLYPIALMAILFLLRMRHSWPFLLGLALALLTQLRSPEAVTPLQKYDSVRYFANFHLLFFLSIGLAAHRILRAFPRRHRPAFVAVCLLVVIPFAFYVKLPRLQFSGTEEHVFIRDFLNRTPRHCMFVYPDEKNLKREGTLEEGKPFLAIARAVRPDSWSDSITPTSILAGSSIESDQTDSILSGGACVFFYSGSLCRGEHGETNPDCEAVRVASQLVPVEVHTIRSGIHFGLAVGSKVRSPDDPEFEIGFYSIEPKAGAKAVDPSPVQD